MLNMIKETGRIFSVTKVPYEKEYKELLKGFTDKEFTKLWNYVDSALPNDKFSVGTTFPLDSPHWGNGPLKVIYVKCRKDKAQAGYLLGQIVFDIILNRNEEWFCTKTNITHRDFETLFYFRGNDQ